MRGDVGLSGNTLTARMNRPGFFGRERQMLGSRRARSQTALQQGAELTQGEWLKVMSLDAETAAASEPRQVSMGSDDQGGTSASRSTKPSATQRTWHAVDLIAIDQRRELVTIKARRLLPPLSVGRPDDVVQLPRLRGTPVFKLS